MTWKRIIMHIDMDAFYASVEQRDYPEYRGEPVIVGADPKGGKGRGVVSAASYEARQFGIHSAMPISQAYKRCPHGIFVHVRGKRYLEVSCRIMTIFSQYTPIIQAISLDEAFLDMTGTERLLGDVESTGRTIQKQIWEEEHLTASVGIGPNKLIAKIASDLEKPNGFVVVPQENIEKFLKPLPIKRLWGIGVKTEAKLKTLGLHTVGDLAIIHKEDLKSIFGHLGEMIWYYAHGIDESRVIPDRDPKSISNETTFSTDEENVTVIMDTIHQLSEKVGYRLRRKDMIAKTVILKIRLGDFTTFVRHLTCTEPFFDTQTIFNHAKMLFQNIDIKNRSIRLVGVGVTQLLSKDGHQPNLFSADHEKENQATLVLDQLKNKFGQKVIGKGMMRKK